MSFQDDMDRFLSKVHSRERTLYRRCCEHAAMSIVNGSPITGAPGQPVRFGDLKKSWRYRIRGKRNFRIESDSPYAGVIEDNRRGARLHSKVGGFHSVKLTRLGWKRIVEYELKAMGLGPGDGNDIPNLTSIGQMRNSRGQFRRRLIPGLMSRG
jgi:hypothetical protein